MNPRQQRAAACAAVLAALSTSPAALAERPSIAALQAQLATLQSQVESGTIPGAAAYLAMDTSNPQRPTLRLTGANLQVVNFPTPGAGIAGVGNVIIGHDQPRLWGSEVCSKPQFANPTDCASGGGVWALEQKSGYHNLVIGERHRYSAHSGLVAGYRNDILGGSAAVVGGEENAAYGNGATVGGGQYNYATGSYSSVAGGYGNYANGYAAAAGGGNNRVASGLYDWVAGALWEDD